MAKKSLIYKMPNNDIPSSSRDKSQLEINFHYNEYETIQIQLHFGDKF